MNLWAASDGSRCRGEINAADGTCDICRRGDVTHCGQRSVLGILRAGRRHGRVSDTPARNLHRVPDAVTDMQAVFVEPLAAALEITDRIHIRPSQRVAIVGDGKLGLLVAQVLQLTGCQCTSSVVMPASSRFCGGAAFPLWTHRLRVTAVRCRHRL